MASRSTALAAAACAVAIALAFALYQPALSIGLLSDDYALLMWARRLELMPRDWGQIRPLPIVTWWLIAQVTPTASTPAALHALNIALHGLNAALVGVIATRLTSSPAAALAASALFLTIPIAVEPVAWGSGVFDTMLATFALGLAVIATRRAQLSAADQAGSLLLAAAMLACKETGVIAAPLFLLLHWVRWGHVDRTGLTIALAQALLTVLYVLGRELTDRLDERLTPWLDAEGAQRLVSGIARGFLLPLHRDIVITHPLLAGLVAIGLVVVLLAWLTRCRQSLPSRRIAVLVAAGTLICVAPTIRIFGVTSDLQGTRYLYLSNAWWSIALGSALLDGWSTARARIAAGAVALVVVAGAALATRQHLEPWTAARRERDRTLLQLISLPLSCRRVAATAATDTVAGAYVFRNGLNEALASLGRTFEWVETGQAPSECQVNLNP